VTLLEQAEAVALHSNSRQRGSHQRGSRQQVGAQDLGSIC